MNDHLHNATAELGVHLNDQVLEPMKRRFVDKDEVIDLLGVCLVGGENLFLLGPPGTAKTALVHDMASRFDGRVFDYLLTRFTEPNELFGPFDIRRLREGDLVTNTEGMLPEASFVFLDELLNANSAILNSLLMVLNERVFRRGRETRKLPLLMVVGASNRLPEDEALGALFDRFLLRVVCDNVEEERLRNVLDAGWRIDQRLDDVQVTLRIEDVKALQAMIAQVEIEPVRPLYVDLIHKLRNAGITISDRRAVKLQRMIAASSLLCGRTSALASDLWVMNYIWDAIEQREVLAEIVKSTIESVDATEDENHHPRAMGGAKPDADALSRELDDIAKRLGEPELAGADRACLQDRIGVLTSRIAWVDDGQQRTFLEQKVKELWQKVEATV